MTVRTISADMDDNDCLVMTRDNKGYMGESNANLLSIMLNNEFGLGDYDYYTLLFDTGIRAGKFSSNIIKNQESFPAYLNGSAILCPLTNELTKTGKLLIQVRAHRDNGNGVFVERRSSVLEIEFLPSIMGTQESVSNSATFEQQVRNAVEILAENEKKWNEGLRVFHYSEMPTPDAALAGSVVQFTGESGEFENGYFYRCIENNEGGYEWQRTNTQPDYELPTASETEKGGIRPGYFMKMDGEELDFNTERTRTLARFVVCEMVKKNSNIKTLMCRCEKACYKSEEDYGEVTSLIASLMTTEQKVLFVPLDGMDDFRYLNFGTGELVSVNISSSYIYKFTCDEEGNISHSTMTAYELTNELNNHTHEASQIKDISNHNHAWSRVLGRPMHVFFSMDGSMFADGNEVTFKASYVYKSSFVYCVPAPNCAAECERTGARLTRQEEGLLGFTADIQPEGEIKFNVIIFNN